MPPQRRHDQISTLGRKPYDRNRTGGYDTEVVLERQRGPQKARKKRQVICEFLGRECPFKEHGVFRNIAELKEDALRHLNPFQCEKCGKRFGKRYGLNRHTNPEKKRSLCTPVQEGLGGNCKPVVWVSPELEAAVMHLENISGKENVIAAIHKCKLLYFGGPGTPNLEAQSQCQDNPEQTKSITFPVAQQGNNIPLPYSPQSSSPPGPPSGFPQSPLAMGGCGTEHLSNYEVPCPTTGDATVIDNSLWAGTYMIYGLEPLGVRELIMNQVGTGLYEASLQDLSSETGSMESVPADARPTILHWEVDHHRENRILAAYLPNEAECSVPLPVTPHEALAHIEGLLLFSLQAEPTANINELQEVLKREKKRIETLEIQRRVQHIQHKITDFLGPAETASYSFSSSSSSAP